MLIFLGQKFDLKLLKSSEVLLHEECEDDRYSKIYERFKEDKVLYNPLIAGRHDNKYVLIDGANRFEALRKMGCKTILAQIVNYKSPKLTLKSWYHFVTGLSLTELKKYLDEAGYKYSKWSINKKLDKLKYIGVCGRDGKGISIKLGKKLEEIIKTLVSLNRYYENKYSYVRIDSDADFSNLNEVLPGEGLLFLYPAFKKKHIVQIAGLTNKMPAGITRHLLPNRVLHIKYEIEKLIPEDNLEFRNRELDDIINMKSEMKKVRLYKEPILIFDE